MNHSPTAIDVHHLSVVMGGQVLVDDISFSVRAGETAALIGPNGAGKSMLVKAMLGLVPKADGVVSFFGKDAATVAALQEVSYVPQSLAPSRSFPLTTTELCSLYGQRLIGLSPEETERMHELLALVGMEKYSQAPITKLSGGQLQRVLIAVSLFDSPRLLIMDEPSAGIDIEGQETIYEVLHSIQEKEQITYFLISHELDVVMEYADQVLCLNKNLLCAGAPHSAVTGDILQRMYGSVGLFNHRH